MMASVPVLLCRLATLLVALGLAGLPYPGERANAAGWPVRMVVVTTFQNGPDIAPGSDPDGELRLWAEGERLTDRIDLPGGVHPILCTHDHRLMVILTGMSLVNAGLSVMALGTDERFDLRKAYWLVAGIAGVDPQVASIGSAAWSRFVLNDVAQSIDMREAPAGWPYGVFANDAKRPDSLEGAGLDHGADAGYPIVFTLNAGLAQWAWSRTRDVRLPETAASREFSSRWSGYAGAGRPPRVFLGDSFASDLYWHGVHLNEYARDWVKLFTAGKGLFAMSDMEDSAIAAAMVRLDRMGRANFQRLMVLRTASNYTLPPPGRTALASIADPYPENGRPAYEAAWLVGSAVVHDLLANWTDVADHTPSAPAPKAAGAIEPMSAVPVAGSG